MAISNYDITAAAFRPEGAHHYELSILTGMDSFAYIIRDRTKNQLLAYRSYTLDRSAGTDWEASLDQLVRHDDRLRSLTYGSCLLGWESERLTLVPRPLYDATNPTLYLEQLTTVGLDDTVRTEYFHELEAQVIFAAVSDRLLATERRLRPLRTHHVASGLLVAWGARARRLNHQAVSCAVRGNKLFVAAHERGRLLFYNTFPFASSPDALYFLLLAYEQCGWSPARVPLYLCGEITEHSKLHQDFYRYVEDIRFCQYPTPPAAPPELAGLPGHLFFELLCLG